MDSFVKLGTLIYAAHGCIFFILLAPGLNLANKKGVDFSEQILEFLDQHASLKNRSDKIGGFKIFFAWKICF